MQWASCLHGMSSYAMHTCCASLEHSSGLSPQAYVRTHRMLNSEAHIQLVTQAAVTSPAVSRHEFRLRTRPGILQTTTGLSRPVAPSLRSTCASVVNAVLLLHPTGQGALPYHSPRPHAMTLSPLSDNTCGHQATKNEAARWHAPRVLPTSASSAELRLGVDRAATSPSET